MGSPVRNGGAYMPVPPAAVLPSGCGIRRDRPSAGDPPAEVSATLAKASSAAIPGSTGAPGPHRSPWSGRYATYRSSKTALNALTMFYAHTLADDGIKVNALAPGLRRTDLNASAGPPVQPSRLTLSTRSSSSPRGPGPIGEVAQLAGHDRRE